ncbi:unnamed protein product [Blepharisma stoltei]|uniref:Uncharacterized protein n=1 Tax=Blepharisma stoltei TaxID=1481888 RepID=A0AAU9J2S7_9CILI|nr:unnamed protein product [Blepharisma stoltei]
MSRPEKKSLTRHDCINSYKSQPRRPQKSPEQVFGLIPETSFTKHQFTPRRIEWIRNYNLYASFDEKSLYLFDSFGTLKNTCTFFDILRVHACCCFTYIEPYHVFVVISTDFRLFLLSDLFEIWRMETLGPGRIQHVTYIHSSNHLILCGISNITVMKLICESKYDIEKGLLLDPGGGFVKFEIELIKSIDLQMNWMKGMRIDKKFERLSVWSESSIAVLSLGTYDLQNQADDLCPGTLITDTLYCPPQGYCVCATSEGQIFVYKLGSRSKPIHTFDGHNRSILALAAHSNPNLFLSASIDCTMKIWSIEHFHLIYTFKTHSSPTNPINFISFIDSNTLATYTGNKLSISRINLVGDFFAISKSAVKEIKWINKFIGVLSEDNSVILYDLTGKLVTTIYPPPTANDVKEMFYIKEIDRVLLLLYSGSMCIFRYEGETGLLEKIIYTGDIKDSENRAVLAPVKAFKPLNVKPPHYDCELAIKKKLKDDLDFFESHAARNPHKFAAMSVGKGALLFMQVENLDSIYGRYILHREVILMIEELPGYLITLCAGNILLISFFSENQLQKAKKIDIRRNLSTFRALSPSKIFLGFESGQSELLRIENKSLYRLTNKVPDADSAVLSIDLIEDFQIFLTAANNQKIRLWNFSNQLIQEIIFPQRVKSLLFLDQKSLLAATGSVISIVNLCSYNLSTEEEEEEILPEDYFKDSNNEAIKKAESGSEDGSSDDLELNIDNELSRRESKYFQEEHAVTPEYWNKVLNSYHNTAKSFNPKMRDKSEKRSFKKKPTNKRKTKKNNIRSLSRPRIQKRPPSPLSVAIQEGYKEVITQKLPLIYERRRFEPQNLLTRRQLTEEKIVTNVKRYGDPADRVDHTGLCVIDEALYFQEIEKLRAKR